MTEIMNTSGNRRGARSLQIDMTPMVDLGFLLITFFIFTTAMGEPKTLKLLLPTEEGGPTHIAETKSLTILLNGDEKAICYEGIASENPHLHRVDMTPGSGQLRDVILNKQKALAESGVADAMTVIIKPGTESNYRQLIAVLDEMIICQVKKYAVGVMDNDDQLLVYSQ